MKRPIFIDSDGQSYFEDARGDLRDHRGQMLEPEQEAAIKEVLRLLAACKATAPAMPESARPRLHAAVTRLRHSMDDGSGEGC
jgi:hypothetical protein